MSMDNKNEKLPAVSPLPEDREIVDEIRSEVSRLRQDTPEAAAQVVSGMEQEMESLEQAVPVRSVSEVRPVAPSAGEDKPVREPTPEIPKPANAPVREIPTPSVPQKEIPAEPISTPEIAEAEPEARGIFGKKQKKEKEKKSRKSRRKQKEQELEQEIENDIYQGVHIRSFAEIKKDMEENGPKPSEPTSTFTYLFDDTAELPKVLLSKDPEELKRQREERAKQAMEDALTETPIPHEAATEPEPAVDAPIAPEFGHRQAAKPDDRPILIDGFDYTEWKRTTQSIPKITDEMLAAHAAEQAQAEESTLPIHVHPEPSDDAKLPVEIESHTDQHMEETIRELEALMEQALAAPEDDGAAVNIDEEPTIAATELEPDTTLPEPAAETQTTKAEPTTDAAPAAEPTVSAEAPAAKAVPAETSVPEPAVPEDIPAPAAAEAVASQSIEAPQPEPKPETKPEPRVTASPTETAIKETAPTVHFVPVADPERYRFHQIPVRTFRLDQINQILVSEIDTFRSPEPKEDPAPPQETPLTPPAAELPKAVDQTAPAAQPGEKSSAYGKVISIPTGSIDSMEAAIAAAIQQAEAKEANDKQQEAEIAAQTAAAAEAAKESQPEKPEEAPVTEPAEAPTSTAEVSSASEPAAITAEVEPEITANSEATEETPTAEAPDHAPAGETRPEDTSTTAGETETQSAETTDTEPEQAEPEPEPEATPADPDMETASTSAASDTEKSDEPEKTGEIFEKIAAFPKPAKKEELATAPQNAPLIVPPALEIPAEEPETDIPPKKEHFSFLHKQGETTEPFEVYEEPDEQPEKYTPDSDPKKISNELQTATKELHIRTFVTGFFMAALLALGFIYEKCIPDTVSPLPYLIINLACVVIPAAVCFKTLWNGVKALFGLQGNTDSGISIAVLATIIHAVSLFFSPGMVMTGTVHLYSAIAVGALFVNSLGKLSMMNRIARNFIFVNSADVKCSVEIYEDMNTAIQLAKGCVNEAPKIAYQQKTKFLKNFLKHSYESDPSMRTSQLIAPIALVASVVLCIVTMIITGNVILGLTALSVATCISAPIASLLCVNLPVANLCNLARRHGAMLVGYEAVEKLSNTNAVMIDSTDLFPKNSVSLADVKVYAGKKTERSIFNAAAVMSNIGGTLRDLFEGVITSQKEMLPKATNIAYVENQGLSGTVAGKRILVGNRAMMEANGIDVPNDDKAITLQANQCITFLAEDNELMAMLTITYEPDPNTVHEMQRLESCGIAAIVRTLDPNLTATFLSTLFLVEENTVKVLPAELGSCCDKELQTAKDECDALLATRGKSFSMMRMLSACVRQKHNISLSVTMQIVSVILGFVLVAFLSCYAGLQQLSTLAILIYEAVWLAAIIIIPKLRKP